jgi:rhodanese-related sulfurtransferase
MPAECRCERGWRRGPARGRCGIPEGEDGTLNAENYAQGHVPGAVNVDYEKMTPEMLPSDKAQALVFYCAGPMCPVSDMAAKKAAKWGHTNVWVYKGGIKQWRSAGMAVAEGN